jgi:uncharacterized protein
MNVKDLINNLQLQPHPEGGYYRETYRSSLMLDYNGKNRPAATSIYFLLEPGNFSAFHRIDADEGWHFYSGSALLVHVIHLNGSYECIRLGNDPEKNEVFHAIVPAGAWFASECAPGSAYSLVGCTVSPGFDFDGFELAFAQQLSDAYPQQKELITRLCRQ